MSEWKNLGLGQDSGKGGGSKHIVVVVTAVVVDFSARRLRRHHLMRRLRRRKKEADISESFKGEFVFRFLSGAIFKWRSDLSSPGTRLTRTEKLEI